MPHAVLAPHGLNIAIRVRHCSGADARARRRAARNRAYIERELLLGAPMRCARARAR